MEQKELSDEDIHMVKLVLIAILALVIALGVSFYLGTVFTKMTLTTITCSVYR